MSISWPLYIKEELNFYPMMLWVKMSFSVLGRFQNGCLSNLFRDSIFCVDI